MVKKVKSSQGRVCGVFQHGPLHGNRISIANRMKQVLKTGDIAFRLGNEGFWGIPFSGLVARLTGSKWSHASVVYWEGDSCYLVEVNDRGTQQCRLVDWIDFCTSGGIAVYRRAPEPNAVEVSSMLESIGRFLSEDPDYDFTFDTENAYYCTESVVRIWRDAGWELPAPAKVKDLIPSRSYWIGAPINWLVNLLTGKGVSLNKPVYVVGNESQGMLSSDKLELVYECNKAKRNL